MKHPEYILAFTILISFLILYTQFMNRLFQYKNKKRRRDHHKS